MAVGQRGQCDERQCAAEVRRSSAMQRTVVTRVSSCERHTRGSRLKGDPKGKKGKKEGSKQARKERRKDVIFKNRNQEQQKGGGGGGRRKVTMKSSANTTSARTSESQMPKAVAMRTRATRRSRRSRRRLKDVVHCASQCLMRMERLRLATVWAVALSSRRRSIRLFNPPKQRAMSSVAPQSRGQE